MKYLFSFLPLTFLLLSSSHCGSKDKSDSTYKGRLEIKGICANITISVIEGKMDTSMIVSKWTDEQTGKSYSNVFKLGSPCNFPATLNAGDEFYFKVDTSGDGQRDCIVCMAYYPTPPKVIPIKVVEK